jgi:hypothetical protein
MILENIRKGGFSAWCNGARAYENMVYAGCNQHILLEHTEVSSAA